VSIFDPRTVHPVASCYTDWATGPTVCTFQMATIRSPSYLIQSPRISFYLWTTESVALHILPRCTLDIRGKALAQSFETLRYKPGGRIFGSRRDHWNYELFHSVGHNMTLGSTQPLTGIRARDKSGRRTFMYRLYRNCWSLILLDSQVHVQACKGVGLHLIRNGEILDNDKGWYV
jgi:hypothetical protein